MDGFLPLLTIFMLAVFVGVEIITKVPPLLHTPLMSGSNAISGITIIGALLSVAAEGSSVVPYLNRLSDLVWTLARWREGVSLATRSVPDGSTPDRV